MSTMNLKFNDLIKALHPSGLDEEFFYKTFTCLFSCILVPFIIFWFMKEQHLLAFLESLLLLFFCLNLRRMFSNKTEILPRTVVMASIGCQLLVLCYYVGISASLWTYPMLTTFFFILPIRKANYAAIAVVLPMCYILSLLTDYVFIIRYLSSIASTLLIANLIIIINNNLRRELIQQSISDPLTHCFNRRHMDTNVEQINAAFMRTATPVCILLIDIDHFKQINDRFGHLAGDEALRKLVVTINDSLRASDMLFRYGGEEFVVLLPETKIEDAVMIADKIRILLSKIAFTNGIESLTVSIGVCELEHSMRPDDWMKGADQALYQAKDTGRNKVCAFCTASA